MSSRVPLILIAFGMILFVVSIVLMVIGEALASLLSAALGFTSLTVGADLYRSFRKT
ncbi:MAG: hypothetical protein P3X22_006260 [Thermoprotei archaeon]|nr:hypothetical protein [Thermoprotei archaeon]